MDFIHAAKESYANKDFDTLLELIPYSKLLGIRGVSLGNELVFVLPANPNNIGNPMLPAIHGGAIGGFMENAALLHVLTQFDLDNCPKTIDFSLDYLRAGKDVDTYAQCKVVRRGRQVINVSVTSWQTHQQEPIAEARAHLLTKG
ncbi:MAG: PaaI family thioesterase [Pseudomonadota bacterium]